MNNMKLSLQQISKSYGDKEIIKNVSLTIADHSFTTLLGPSGCGKTTLLRMLAGLETPDEGEIWLGDTCVYSAKRRIFVPPEKRGLGFVFQDFALWPHMTIYENVAFGLRAQGRTEHLDEEVRRALSIVQLEGFENRHPDELSGGQQQRVAFARAIVIRPECILFDEPLSALDALLRIEMRQEVRKLVTQLGITAVFVTHDQEEAMSMSDAIAVINQGHIEQYDKPELLYSNPQTDFVARFIGTSNWLDEHHLFRPEKAHETPAEGDDIFTATVTSNQFLGHAYQLQLEYQGRNWTHWTDKPGVIGQNLTLYVAPKDVVRV